MKKKTIGILLIILVLFISIGAISAADANETLMEEVSDTNIATTSVAVEQDNAISQESENGGDVEINVTDSRDEISTNEVKVTSKSNEVLSASNDDVLKASSNCFYWVEGGRWYEDLRDAMDNIAGSSSKTGTILVNAGTYTELDRVTCGDIYIHFESAATITIQPFNKGDAVIFDGSVAKNNYLFWLDHQDLKVTFNDITFKKGHATADGGAIEVAHGQVTLNNCLLTENEALDHGGAISVADAGTFIANNCRFINNWAEDDGGAISCEDDGTVELNNCYFEGNKKIKDSIEEENDFGYEDGAGSPGYWTFNDCQFKGHGSLEIEVDAPNQSVEITPDIEDEGVNLVVLYKDGSYNTEKPWASLHSVEFTDLEPGTYTVYMMKDHEKRYIYPDNTFTIIEANFVLDDKDVFETLSAAVNAIPNGGSGVITVEANTYTGSANFNVQIRNKVVTIRPKIISEYEDTVIFSADSQSYLLNVGSNAQLILEDIVITGKFSDAALIFTSDLDSSITDCEFNNIKNSENQPGTPINAENSKLELNGTNFELNGNIILKNTDATINECTFTNNTGEQGGAIDANPSSDLTITSSEFTHNIANEGGAIYATNLKVEGSEFTLNVAELGGAVYITDKGDSLVNITSSVFDSNVATNSRNIYSASPTRKFNLEFNEYDLDLSMNEKDASYGADYILTGVFDWGSNLNNDVTLLSGTIDENIFGEVLTVENNTFNINLGVLSGGTHELSMIGMFTQGDSADHFYTHMYYSDLNGNEFYLTNPAYLKVVISKAKILLNLEVKDVLIPEIPILNVYANWDNNYTIFIGNKYYQLEVVKGKGSMQLTGLDLGNYSVVAMRDADENFDFVMNFTTFSISKTYSNFIVLSTNVEYDTLAEAVANSDAEDTIYVKKGTYTDTKIVISNKTLDIVALENAVFDAQGSDANFIIINQNAEVYIHGITFRGIHNRNTNYGAIVNHGYLSVDSCNFTDNKITKTSFAGNGGAAIFSDGESLEIDNCNFINNVAPLKASTAAVTSLGYEDISITDSKFINNTARDGGAVHFENISQFEPAIISCEFEQNTAVKGSAIYVGNNSRYVSVTLSNFVKNNVKNSLGEKAQLEGGAIYVNANNDDVALDISLSNFEHNSNSDVDGGAICLDGSSNAFIDSCVFNNNSGKLGSAILIKNPYDKKLTLLVDSSLFTDNHATTGAVATSPRVTALFDECIFANNTGENRNIYSNGFTVAHDTVFDVKDAKLSALSVSYGNDSIIKGTVDIGANIYSVANLTVDGENVIVEVENNKFTYNAGVLNQGKHTAVLNNVVDMNNNTYLMDSITVNFKVNRAGVEFNVSVDNITYGETLKVVETLPSTVSGTVSYQLNGKYYTKDELESLKLDAGNYTLVASYNNENYVPSTSIINFVVNKANPTISVEDVEVEDNGTVVVNIKTNVPSIYTIEIGDYKTDKYVNGSRSVEIDKIFEPGTYTIKVTSQERVNYISNFTEATLKVTKTLGAFTLSASNKVTSPNNAIIGVSAPENAVGNITYTITDSNKNVVKTLTQSCRDDLIVSGLDAGDYEINAVFEGDDLYYSTSNIKMAPLSIMRAANNEDIRTSGEDDYIDDEYYNYPFIYQEDEDSDYEYYETLEEAIDAASLMGGIITVRGGTYYYEDGNAGIDIEGELEITIRAFEGEEVIFDCQHESDFLYLTYDTEVEVIEAVPPIPVIYNTPGPTITLENLTVINGYAVSDGAVIEMDAGILTLMNCNFYNNDAEYGGVIYIGSASSDQDADVIAVNCTFINNTARSEGGAIYISEGLEQFVSASFAGCTFLDNYQGEGDERTMNYFAGDAVEEIVKKACVFNGKGTLDFNVDKINQTVTVVGTSEDVFDSVVLMYFGHVPLYSIYNNGSQSFNVTFEDVMGGNYTIGVMNDHDLNTYIFTDKQFEMKVPNFIISEDEVYENLTDAINAVEENGIIYANINYHIDENMEIVFNKSFTLKNFRDRMVVFDGNSTNWFFTVPEGYNVVIENIEFVDGGIKDHASIENYGSLTLKNCTFTAFEIESIIYNSGSLNITGGVFSLNSINNAIVLNDGNLFIDGAEFSSNVINTNSVVYNNGNAEIVASNFTENVNNGNGGAIYNKNSLTIKDTVFNENEGINGGAVYNEGTLEVLNSTFEDNTAKGYGGAIFNDGEANIDNSSFSGGFSEKDGGALYNNNVMIVNNSNLVANTATGNGGAIYNNKTLKLTESFFGINFAYEFANIYNAGDVEVFKNNTFDFYDVILYVPDGEYGIPTTITGTLDSQFNMDIQLILPEFVNYEDALVAVTDGIFEYNTGILPKGAYDVILNEILYDTNGNVYYGEAIRDRLIINKAKVYINLTVDDIIIKNADTVAPVLKISASKNGTFQLLFNNRLTTFTIAGTEANITLDSVGEGNYSVMVIREGDENFNDAVNTTTFTVSEYIGNFIVNSTGGKFETLYEAITNSAAEDIIYVMEGNYTGFRNSGLGVSGKKLSIISIGEVVFEVTSGSQFLTVKENSDVTISDAVFTGFSSIFKEAIFLNSGNLTIDGCAFVNNDISDNSFLGVKGTLISSEGNLNIIGSEFYDNKIHNTYLINSKSGIIINESRFENNELTAQGGLINIANANSAKVISTEFAENIGTGSIINIEHSNDVLISSDFYNNTQANRVIYALNNTNLNIENSTFIGNILPYGYIIKLDENNQNIISKSIFTDNTAQNVVFSEADNTLSISESTFTDNTIRDKGAIYIASMTDSTVDGCVFTGNKADSYRNIYSVIAELNIINSVFDAVNVDCNVSDIDYGQTEIINGTIDIGTNFGFTVNININNKVYPVNVTNNKFTYTLSNLTGGEYEVVLNAEDNNSNTFVFDKITKTFAVNRIDPGLKVTISNITQGEKLEVNAELINNATDKILYQLNGKWYDEAQLENLTLNHGNYFVTAAYGGNKNYYPVGVPIYVEVYKITPNITVSDAEANYGEDIEINVKVDVADYYTVFIDDRYEESVSLYIDGSGTFIVPSENFKPGKYEIKVYKIETDNYNEAYGYANLTINNATGLFRISNNTIKYGENVTVRVTSPVNAYGNITYKVYQNADVVYTVTQSCVEDLVLPNLSVGTYIITGTFEGDSYYTNESKVISGGLRIIIKDVNLNVTVSNITYGENAVVTVDADADGKYLVYVGNETYEVTVINGTGNVSVPDLTVGIYKVNASAVDDNYSAFNETAIEVTPKSVSVEVSVENIVEGENAVVTVKADVDGEYLVNVGNETYEVTVTDGTGNVSVPDLTAGKYDVNVTADNGNYTGSNSTAFTVKHTTILVPDVVVDENNVTITVNVDKDATGFVKFTTGGNDLFVEVKDGKAFINTVLPVGNYTVVATYVGDDNFAANSTDINFTVEEKPLIDTPIAIDTQIDENNITMIVSVDENATGLVKFEVTGAEEYTVYAEVENGKAILEDVLTVGDYTVVATYLGDDNYSSNSTEESFTIVGHIKKDTAITAVPTVDGTSVTIVSTVDKNATGYVTIAILGQTFVVPVKDGEAVFTYDFA
uniref:Ig-like domain repeat protein n=1 Tax=Methanobrevibacter sp. TaxID=66852 RepID=UPI00388F37B3